MITPSDGILLIADPFLKDPNFLRTVVLICEHNANGTLGFVINKKIDFTLDELVDNFEGFKLPVYCGGPMQPDTLHFIHECPNLIPEAKTIGNGMYWSGNFEVLTTLIKNNSIDVNKIKLFVGYSGWDKNQLQAEINDKDWLTVAATKKIVFTTSANDVWKKSLKLLGEDYEMLKNFPLDPQLN